MAGTDWRLDQKTEETPQETDLSMLVRGTSVFKTTFKKIKEFIIGTESMGTTATEVTSAIKEINTKVGNIDVTTDGTVASQLENLNQKEIDTQSYGEFSTSSSNSIESNNNGSILIMDTTVNSNKLFTLNSNGSITINKDGLYYIEGIVVFDPNDTGHREIEIATSEGVSRNMTPAINTSKLGMRMYGNIIRRLSSGQIVRIQVAQTSGAALNATGNIKIIKIA